MAKYNKLQSRIDPIEKSELFDQIVKDVDRSLNSIDICDNFKDNRLILINIDKDNISETNY